MNLVTVKDGWSVIFVGDKRPMSKLKTTAFIVDVQLVEPLVMCCVQSAKFSNVLPSQITMMVSNYTPDLLIASMVG